MASLREYLLTGSDDIRRWWGCVKRENKTSVNLKDLGNLGILIYNPQQCRILDYTIYNSTDFYTFSGWISALWPTRDSMGHNNKKYQDTVMDSVILKIRHFWTYYASHVIKNIHYFSYIYLNIWKSRGFHCQRTTIKVLNIALLKGCHSICKSTCSNRTFSTVWTSRVGVGVGG